MAMQNPLTERHLDWCKTERQREIVEALLKCGNSTRRAAKLLGCSEGALGRTARNIYEHAALHGYAPDYDMVDAAPDPFVVKRHSQFYDKDGKPTNRWVIKEPSREKLQEHLAAAVEAFKEEIPRAEPVKAPPKRGVDPELLNLYIITDYHLGMLAWSEETKGDDWDVRIAEKLLIDWFAYAIEKAPGGHTAVLCNLGDFLHFDSLEAITRTSGHLLDADTRFPNIVRAAIRVFRQVVEMLLRKYREVRILHAEGNHDIVSSVWLREMFSVFYQGEKRVVVDTNPDPYYVVEWGLVALFFHHGHLTKFEKVHDVLIHKFREVIGRTKYCYGHAGHLHHMKALDGPVVSMEQHETLAPRDAYASRSGYPEKRNAKVITYHRQRGELGRLVIAPEMVSNER